MARNFMYVYERIYKEASEMHKEFAKLQINGRQTSGADQKRIRKIISDSAYQVAQECSVLVSYPKMHIEGREVVLGEPTIMLPDCRLVSMEELKKIELGADRPKTQKSILKVGNNIQNMITNKNKIDEMNGYDISLDAKVENDGRSETVFGQSGGG